MSSKHGRRILHTGNRSHQPSTDEQREKAKKYGLAHGYFGMLGGWIHNKDGDHVAHGWGQFYGMIGGAKIERWIAQQSAPQVAPGAERGQE